MDDDQKERPESLLPYEQWIEQALRQVVALAIEHAASQGLPGGHHFYITFRTDFPGVVIPSRIQAQYPREMTIVLQHQFWDLAVSEAHFEVALSFNGVSEKLHVPLDAIKGFFDPSVQFGLQFETLTETKDAPAETPAPAPVIEEPKAGRTRRKPVAAPEPEPPPAIGPAEPAKAKPKAPAPVLVGGTDNPEPDKPSGGAEVVRLDRFRKK
jgi:uncharacterized protein